MNPYYYIGFGYQHSNIVLPSVGQKRGFLLGVSLDQQKRGLVVLGGKKVKKEGRSDRGGLKISAHDLEPVR